MLDFLKNKLIVGRGATAIYLLLKAKFRDAEVIVPSNICYAAVYPIIYSGNKPVFCDVDNFSGNITLETLIIAMSKKTRAIIVPHMYGNPATDIENIVSFCKDKGIIVIEDCASAMGATLDGVELGSFGDYSVFSTGYSKTIDLGDGGILASNNDLEKELKLYNSLNLFEGDSFVSNSMFSQQYRLFRNSKTSIIGSEFYQVCHRNLAKNFIYRLSEEFEDKIRTKIELELDYIINVRRKEYFLYNSLIEYCEILKPYFFADGSVPWRFNINVSSDLRDIFVQKLLEKKVPVSDWYPVSSILFDDYSLYKNAYSAEKSILNFPLLIGENRIREICTCINSIKDELNNGNY